MTPAVPFALLGAVQLIAVAVWLAFAGAVCLPQLRRPTTPLIVAGALAMVVAESLTAVRLDTAQSDGLAEIRITGLALLALGFAAGSLRRRATVVPAIVVPIGASPSISLIGGAVGIVGAAAVWLRSGRGAERAIASWVAGALVLAAAAEVLADPARNRTNAAIALLIVRAASSLALAVALFLIARETLLAKFLGAIVAGVVLMAVGAVSLVGTGVAGDVQRDQSQRLLSVANGQQQALQTLATRAGLFAQIVAQCPSQRSRCIGFLDSFSDDPDYFAVIDRPGGHARMVAPSRHTLDPVALSRLAASAVVRSALSASASTQSAASGPLVVATSPNRLAIVAAVPGRPGGSTNAQVAPTFAAVYGIELADRYLTTLEASSGYDLSIIVGQRVLGTSLDASAARQVLTKATARRVAAAGPTATEVLSAQGTEPTIAFVPITAAGNDDVRIATLAVSQPASAALEAERSVLRRLVLTALAVLVVVSILAVGLAQRIVDPVRRLTLAAGRVRRGDLDATVSVRSGDEVGLLARAFDAMTLSLRALTGDLRESAQSEALLRGRLEAILLSITDGLVTTNADGDVAGVNLAALQLLGAADPAPFLGQPIGQVLVLHDAEGSDVLLRAAPGTVADAALQRPDGSQVSVRVTVAPLHESAGQLVVVSDRTRESEIERMKTDFLSNVSHELRTPLTPIRGYAEMIARRPDLPRETLQGFVGEILSGTTRMNRVVDLLVDVAALEAGRLVSRQRVVRVSDFAEELLADWRARYPARAADLKRRLATRLPAVDIDPVWVRKALDELVDNATKYTPVGTPITLVGALTDDGVVRMSIRDAGEGIDTARLGELLGDFSQADASATRRVGGLGLGLGFVSRVSHQLGVRLVVASSPGHGSEFSLDLPVADRAAVARETAGRGPARGGSR